MSDFHDMDELGRLFLGEVRSRQTEGRPLPQRRRVQHPRPQVSIDLTPEEYARMYGQAGDGNGSQAGAHTSGSAQASHDMTPAEAAGHVEAVIASHLNGHRSEYVRRYARHRAATTDGENKTSARVGLIELDEAGLRVRCLERGGDSIEATDTPPLSFTEQRAIVDALQEMSWDINQWIISVGHVREARIRRLMQGLEAWTLLTTGDHDGVVGAYRTMKMLHGTSPARTTVAVLDAMDDAKGKVVFQKLSHVCTQFLGWSLSGYQSVQAETHVTEHLVIECGGIDQAVALNAVESFLARFAGKDAGCQDAAAVLQADHPSVDTSQAPAIHKEALGEFVVPVTLSTLSGPAVSDMPRDGASRHDRPLRIGGARSDEPQSFNIADSETKASTGKIIPGQADSAEPDFARALRSKDTVLAAAELCVIDLPQGDLSSSALLDAILRNDSGEWVSCPVRPPMCDFARLALDRGGRLMLMAVADAGLTNLEPVAKALCWLRENLALIKMAMPQLAIDTTLEPALRLFVSRGDLSAKSLAPLVESRHVVIQPYARLRWGDRHGLLLDAA